MSIKEKLAQYINENLENNFERIIYDINESCLSETSFKKCEQETSLQKKRLNTIGYSSARKANISLDKFISENKEDNKFQKLLFKHIDDRNLKDSDVYNKVNIDRRLFSKIRNDINYHPSKETIILLAIALELSEDELLDLLGSAEYSLPNNDVANLIIRFCFQEKIYNINTINELLYDYNCKAII